MNRAWFSAFVFCAAGLFSLAVLRMKADPQPREDPPPPGEPVPVIVELFTSEGCSSCPPADSVLTKLVGTQPVAGAHVIALGEHVDYWDRLGWRDPFSSAEFSRRQSDYAASVFHTGSIYTPQMVVAGTQELVGSDYRAATAAIARAARANSASVRVMIDAGSSSPIAIPLQVRVDRSENAPVRRALAVWVAVTEDGLVTHVTLGENRGRELRHTAVVRSLTNIGTVAPDEPAWSASFSAALRPDWKRPAVRLVAFAQDRSTRQVLGATELKP